MTKKTKLATSAIFRLFKVANEGIDKKALMFRTGLTKSDIEVALKTMQEQKVIALSGKGRGTKYIKTETFDQAFVE